MRKTIRDEVLGLFKKSQDMPPSITEANLSRLPEPVQRYLRYTQILGKEIIRTVRLKQKGVFRTKADQKWMPLVAEQYFTTNPPAFLWYGTIHSFPLLSISARDLFFDGRGNMLVKLLSLITLDDARGPEVDQGELTRYLAEIIWFPTAWLSDYIQWQAIDGQSAKVSIHHQGVMASVVLYLNEKGQVTQLTAERYKGEKGKYTLQQWSGQCENYREIDGIWVPTKIEAVWNLKFGDFSYFRGEITQIEYNCSQPY